MVQAVLRTSTVDVRGPRHGMNAGMGPGLERPKPQLLAEVCCFVSDPESGEMVGEVKNFASDSLVIAMLDLLFIMMSGTTLTVTNDAGTGIGMTSSTLILNMGVYNGGSNALNNTALGHRASIVVGLGSASATLTDTGLGTRIAAGSGSGQMFYMAHSVLPPVTTGTTAQAQLIRNFVNTSGGTITVQECGIYSQNTANTNNTFCLIRDTIPGGVAVANGKVLTIVYTVGVSGT